MQNNAEVHIWLTMKLLKRGPSGIKSDAMSKSWFGTGGVPRQSCIFASIMDRGSWLRNLAAPTQTRDIRGPHGKTPVAQMHFVSEFPMSQSGHIILR